MKLYNAGFDGSASPNPGIIKIGGWIKVKDTLISSFQRCIGYGDNNLAEYAALLGVIKEARRLNIQSISIIGDAETVIKHIHGHHDTDHYGMQIYRDLVISNLNHIKDWELLFVPRKQNTEADRLTHF